MAVLGLRFCVRAFSSCGKRGPLFIAVCGPLTIAASLVAEHRLQTRRLSSCSSRAQLLRGMWDLPRPGLGPVSPALAGRFSTTAPPGKPCFCLFSTTAVVLTRRCLSFVNLRSPPVKDHGVLLVDHWVSTFSCPFRLWVCVSRAPAPLRPPNHPGHRIQLLYCFPREADQSSVLKIWRVRVGAQHLRLLKANSPYFTCIFCGLWSTMLPCPQGEGAISPSNSQMQTPHPLSIRTNILKNNYC